MKNTIQNTLHVWHIPLTAQESMLGPLLSILTESEKKIAAQFKFEKHRRRYIVAHANLRIILADQLKIPLNELDIATQEKGKPYITDNPLFFNLSHSEDLAVLAVSWQGNVGIDIEYIKKDISTLEIAQRFFHPLEYDQLKNAIPEQQTEFFYRCWTGKEAFLKTTGLGVANYLQSFALDIQDPNITRLIYTSDELKEFEKWHVYIDKPSNDYLSTIVSTIEPLEHNPPLIYPQNLITGWEAHS